MKKFAVAAAFAGSLFAAPAFAQDATSCDAMLTDFDAHLAANNIQEGDARVAQARTDAQQACMSGDMTTAESTLDQAVADLGIPPRTKTDATAGGTQSGTSGTDESTTNTETTTDTTGSGSTSNTGSSTTGTSTDTQSGSGSSTSTTQ